MSAFRFNAKSAFITYPRCSILKPLALQLLQATKHGEFSRYCIAQEHHEDGGLHLHVFLLWPRKKNIKDPLAFDLSVDGATYHPNIQPVRNQKETLAYLTKEDKEPLTNCDPADFAGDFWAALVHETDPQKAWDMLATSEPKNLVLRFTSVNSFIEHKRSKFEAPPAYAPRFLADTFLVPPLVQEWYAQSAKKLDRCWFLILVGPPNLGKTQMIRSLGPHVYIRGHWSLDKITKRDKTAQYIVLDDVLLNKDLLLPMRPILLAMEGGVVLTDKYRPKTEVDTSGLPVVLVTNDPDLPTLFSASAWDSQFRVISVSSKLFLEPRHIDEDSAYFAEHGYQELE